MAYQGSKFSSRMVEDIFPSYYTNRDDCYHIVNTMLRYFLFKKYKEDIVKEGKRNLEKQNAFYETAIYSSRDIPRIIDNVGTHNEMLLVIKIDDSSRIGDVMKGMGNGYIELNTPDCPINQFILTHTKRPTNVFVNKEKHYVIVFTQNDPIESWYMQLFSCAIKIWSWLFVEPIENELQLCKALSQKDLETFNSIINKIFPEDIFEALKMQQLSQYSKIGIQNKIIVIKDKIESLDGKIHNAHIELKKNLDDRMDKLLELEGLELSLAKDEDNMCSFFQNRKNIEIIKVNIRSGYNPEIHYIIKETLEFYDVDELKRTLNNDSSYFYRSDYYEEWIKTLFNAIFIEDKGKFCVQSEFSLSGLSSITPYTYGSFNVSYDTFLPHPHLGFHACLGANIPQIDNYLMNGDWDLAIDQTIAATKNLNFGDTAVMNSLMRYITRNQDNKYILANNGEKMSVKEFLKYLEKAGDSNE